MVLWTHFPSRLWAWNSNLMKCVFLLPEKLIIRSCYNVTNAMTAKLCQAITYVKADFFSTKPLEKKLNGYLIEMQIWVRSRNCGCLVTWFCYQLIAKPGNKTAAVSWPHPYSISTKCSWKCHQYNVCHFILCIHINIDDSISLTHWGRDKMAAIFQMTFSNGFSWMKMYEFRLTFHWSLFLGVQLTIFQHWFRKWLGANQATSHYLNQWWLDYRRIQQNGQ